MNPFHDVYVFRGYALLSTHRTYTCSKLNAQVYLGHYCNIYVEFYGTDCEYSRCNYSLRRFVGEKY